MQISLVLHYVFFRNVDDRAILKALQYPFLEIICFCSNFKMLATHVPILKHLWYHEKVELQNLTRGTFILVDRELGWNPELGTVNLGDQQQIF